MEQLLLHLLGDYVTQNSEMAQKKTTSYIWAFIHAITYSLPFLLLTKGFNIAWFVILITHFFIDRFRLAKYWIMFFNLRWIKKQDKFTLLVEKEVYKVGDVFNIRGKMDCVVTHIDNINGKFRIGATKYEEQTKIYFNLFKVDNTATGFNSKMPDYLSTWLLIIIDNTFHLVINYLSLNYLM